MRLQSRWQPGLHPLKAWLGLEGLLPSKKAHSHDWLLVLAGVSRFSSTSHPPRPPFSTCLLLQDSLDFFAWWPESERKRKCVYRETEHQEERKPTT